MHADKHKVRCVLTLHSVMILRCDSVFLVNVSQLPFLLAVSSHKELQVDHQCMVIDFYCYDPAPCASDG